MDGAQRPGVERPSPLPPPTPCLHGTQGLPSGRLLCPGPPWVTVPPPRVPRCPRLHPRSSLRNVPGSDDRNTYSLKPWDCGDKLPGRPSVGPTTLPWGPVPHPELQQHANPGPGMAAKAGPGSTRLSQAWQTVATPGSRLRSCLGPGSAESEPAQVPGHTRTVFSAPGQCRGGPVGSLVLPLNKPQDRCLQDPAFRQRLPTPEAGATHRLQRAVVPP